MAKKSVKISAAAQVKEIVEQNQENNQNILGRKKGKLIINKPIKSCKNKCKKQNLLCGASWQLSKNKNIGLNYSDSELHKIGARQPEKSGAPAPVVLLEPGSVSKWKNLSTRSVLKKLFLKRKKESVKNVESDAKKLYAWMKIPTHVLALPTFWEMVENENPRPANVRTTAKTSTSNAEPKKMKNEPEVVQRLHQIREEELETKSKSTVDMHCVWPLENSPVSAPRYKWRLARQRSKRREREQKKVEEEMERVFSAEVERSCRCPPLLDEVDFNFLNREEPKELFKEESCEKDSEEMRMFLKRDLSKLIERKLDQIAEMNKENEAPVAKVVNRTPERRPSRVCETTPPESPMVFSPQQSFEKLTRPQMKCYSTTFQKYLSNLEDKENIPKPEPTHNIVSDFPVVSDRIRRLQDRILNKSPVMQCSAAKKRKLLSPLVADDDVKILSNNVRTGSRLIPQKANRKPEIADRKSKEFELRKVTEELGRVYKSIQDMKQQTEVIIKEINSLGNSNNQKQDGGYSQFNNINSDSMAQDEFHSSNHANEEFWNALESHDLALSESYHLPFSQVSNSNSVQDVQLNNCNTHHQHHHYETGDREERSEFNPRRYTYTERAPFSRASATASTCLGNLKRSNPRLFWLAVCFCLVFVCSLLSYRLF